MIKKIVFVVLVFAPFSVVWLGMFWLGDHLPKWLGRKKEGDK